MKLPAIEKLARRICWLGFTIRDKSRGTEAAYWRGLPEVTREKYREEARWLCWAMESLDNDDVGWEFWLDAMRDRVTTVAAVARHGARSNRANTQ